MNQELQRWSYKHFLISIYVDKSVLQNLVEIEASDILEKLGLELGKYNSLLYKTAGTMRMIGI